MKRKILWLAALGGFLLLLFGAVALYNRVEVAPDSPITAQDAPASAVAGQAPAGQEAAEVIEAPDFSVVDAEGNTVRLSDLRGRPVLLNFWASWCPPCREEMPAFQAAYEAFGDEIHFMMVDLVGGQETQAAGEAYIAEQGFTFPVYFDTAQEGAYAYGIRSIPTSIFIDAEGNVLAGVQGMLSDAVLAQGIELLLGGK